MDTRSSELVFVIKILGRQRQGGKELGARLGYMATYRSVIAVC